MPNAEALLFVDHQQADVLKLQVLREQPVRADQDVDLARFQLFQNDLLLLRRAEARDHLDVDGKLREAAAERFIVLEAEHGGGREHGHLLPSCTALNAARIATSVLP